MPDTKYLFWIWALGLLLFLILVIVEFMRKSDHFYYRIIALSGCVLSLMGIVLKPAFPEKIQRKNLIILTDNYSQKVLDSLQRYSASQVVRWDSLSVDLSRFDKFHLLGAGIPVYDLWQMKDKSVRYVPAELPEGITRIKYASYITAGESVILQGEYRQSEANHVKLILNGPSGKKMDSTSVSISGTTQFLLKGPSFATGELLYTLEVRDTTSLLSSETVPVVAQAPTVMNVFIINDYPTFETRSLKQLLVSEGHKVTVRNKVTQDRYSYEYYNTRARQIDRLTSGLLQAVHVIIIDFDSFKGLTDSEYQELHRQMTEAGLALFIQPDEAMFHSGLERLPFSFSKADSKETVLKVNDEPLSVPTYSYRPVMKLGVEAITNFSTFPVFFFHHSGRGKIGSALLTKTYQIGLQGDTISYNRIWNTVFDRLLADVNEAIELDRQMVYENEPLQVFWFSKDEKPFEVKYRQELLPPIQTALIPEQWSSQLWPDKKGWDELVFIRDSLRRYSFYVHDAADWKTVRQFERINANIRAFGAFTKLSESIKKKDEVTEQIPIEPIWFYLIFLGCAGYLWIEPKF
ncbi:hypothetical protein [Fulvivirga sp. M361]|uniref:hypothetical protein n=1 Tax=Fulvivirga sp. M361 TaxID=2594266 RepID=UPI0016236EB3|nr:hypothetical protein [Fulvivirga sp. M361]